ncbi:hypothetical protein CDV52_14330 [Haematobacter missouriensis]|uniref:Uncharacterized protein n=1 Tax=Haematobacter missouriensis TaxID=366616 RepID=A0A212AMC0_9RHOB|nr:hypothetical protein CDV53_16135 [Haematobacter missouriensis]OWJ82573.1 hypothetical protein CDV52_14330 [Haematobacter missouriensis]
MGVSGWRRDHANRAQGGQGSWTKKGPAQGRAFEVPTGSFRILTPIREGFADLMRRETHWFRHSA